MKTYQPWSCYKCYGDFVCLYVTITEWKYYNEESIKDEHSNYEKAGGEWKIQCVNHFAVGPFWFVDKSETASEANAEVFGALKPTATPKVPGNCVASSSLVPMLNQLPPITWYSGDEQPDGETFQDWLEQFESVAQLRGWNSHAKLVNYKLLAEQLTKRFTPIQIQPIQSQSVVSWQATET